MKKLTLLLITLFASLTLFAGEVTEAEALQKAQQFMQGKQFKQRNLRRAASKDAKNNAYYVFNVEDNGGFVIVSGDDRTTEILGYSDKGNFNAARLPDNVRWLLNYYQKTIDSLRLMKDDANIVSRRANKSKRTPKSEIEPLISTQWGQGAPYNNLCPEIDGQHCLTGCVATAMAQVINYNQWPKGETASIEAYTTEKELIDRPQLNPTSFDWEKMTNDDIARLMLYCGQSVKMDYGLSVSGGSIEELCEIFPNIFGYSTAIKSLNRDLEYYDDDLWESVIYDELKAKRVVLYGGFSWSSPNHLWVVDGYKDGFFHMNWGWDGDCDGFYKVSGIVDELISVYDMNHVVWVGIMPPANSEQSSPKVYTDFFTHYCEVSIHNKGYVARAKQSDDFPEFSINSSFRSDIACTQEIGLGLVGSSGEIHCIREAQHTFSANEWYVFDGPITISRKFENGDYRLIAIARNSTQDAWEPVVGSSSHYLELTIEDQCLTVHPIPDGTHSKKYEEHGVKEIDGITYILYKDYADDIYLADVLPKQITGKYSGDVIVPAKVEYNGITYRVFYAWDGFRNCEELKTLTLVNAYVEGNVWNCPKLTKIVLKDGVNHFSSIGYLPLLESIEFPETLTSISGDFISEGCDNLKTIRFNGTIFSFVQEIPDWSTTRLPALTDIYFPCITPPQILNPHTSDPLTDLVPANPNAKIHIPVGSLALYKQSNWKDWIFVEDMPASSAVTWGYCHSDVVSDRGEGVSSRSNYVEYAIRVPKEELEVYKGSQITQIQIFSSAAPANDYHGEDYEYVFITRPGTDYIVKQPFNVVRGKWNKVDLDIPYDIIGEEIFVGVGRYKDIEIIYADMTEVKDAAYGRAMGDDYGCIWEPGEWQNLVAKECHPLPIRFTISGESMPQGLVLREAEIADVEATEARDVDTQAGQSRRAGSGFTLNGVIRNRSLESVSSYTVKYSIDGGAPQTKTFETILLPNATETITIELPAALNDGKNHTISTDVTMVNGTENGLESLNMPIIDIVKLFGDADGDGVIDVNDVTSTINYVLKKTVARFIRGAADMDEDDKIDVNDVQAIIYKALGK